VADRNPRWVRRNALLVLGNSGALLEAPGDSGGGVSRDEITTLLATYFDGDDELLREHAKWAAQRLGLLGLFSS
jgi:epoxyqueuosine reductase QueG